MGEIIDLESYRKQRKRRLAESRNTAKRHGQNRRRTDLDRLRPAVEPLDMGTADRAADTEPDEPSTD
jgi:hypothetical protein